MILQFFDELFARFIAFGEHDGRLYDLSAQFVRYGGNGALEYCGVFHEGALHFERPDAVARTFDDVVFPSDEPIITVAVTERKVAHVVVPVVFYRFGQRVVEVIARKQPFLRVAQADADLAGLSLLDGPVLVVQKLYVIEGGRPAHRTGAYLHVLRKRAAHDRRFRLAEPFVNGVPRFHHDLAVNFGVERFACRHHEFDARKVVFGKV